MQPAGFGCVALRRVPTGAWTVPRPRGRRRAVNRAPPGRGHDGAPSSVSRSLLAGDRHSLADFGAAPRVQGATRTPRAPWIAGWRGPQGLRSCRLLAIVSHLTDQRAGRAVASRLTSGPARRGRRTPGACCTAGTRRKSRPGHDASAPRWPTHRARRSELGPAARSRPAPTYCHLAHETSAAVTGARQCATHRRPDDQSPVFAGAQNRSLMRPDDRSASHDVAPCGTGQRRPGRAAHRWRRT